MGLNASGKSNAIDALLFLQRTIKKDFTNVFINEEDKDIIRGGYEEATKYKEKNFTLGVLFGKDDRDLYYELTCEINITNRNCTILDEKITDPSLFFENYLKNAKVIKTFDLSYKTEIGSYIRRHVEDPLFPESSIYVSFDKNSLSYWQGISYNEGGFCKKAKDVYKDYVLVDKTLIENDDFVTMGFQENSVVHPNILNLEFLFDDVEQTNYKFNRYFGLYVSEAEIGKFILDGNRLFEDKDNVYIILELCPNLSLNDIKKLNFLNHLKKIN
jgi:hypothetical protein